MADLIRTVLVDDEEDVRRLLRVRLERLGGFDVVGEGASGEEAVELCTTHRPDVLVLDAGVPDFDGLAAVPAIRRATPATIVVIYTADSGISTRNEAERVGAHAVVGKADAFDLLVGTIHRLLPDKVQPPDPVVQDRTQFGQRMTALLEDGGDARSGDHWWRRPGATRVWVIVLLVVVVLPMLAFGAWAVAQLAGLSISLD